MRWLALAWARLLARPLRSAVTVLGVAAVAALATAATHVAAAGKELSASQPGEPLIVMQAGRICPSTSHLPLDLGPAISALDGVAALRSQLVVVSDCKVSTTATTFRGIESGAGVPSDLRITAGSAEGWGENPALALVGSQLAQARGVGPGDTLESAGIAVTVAAIVDGERMQDRASVWVDREHLVAALPALAGSATLFEVQLLAGADGEAVSAAIDTSTNGATDTAPFSAAAARVAGSLAQVLQAGGVVALAAAVAGILLLLNATVLGLRSSARDLGVLRAIGHAPLALAAVVGAEGALGGLLGGVIGSLVALAVVASSATAISTEGIAVVIDARIGLVVVIVAAATLLGALAAALPGIWAVRGSLRRVMEAG